MNTIDREKLTEMIEREGGKNWWVPEEFEKHIRSQLPTELVIVAPPPLSSENYNCFVYAFGLEHNPNFLGGQNPIQKEFIRYLLSKSVLQIKAAPEAGDLVFYEDASNAITHAGIMQSQTKVISKWMWGCTFEHDLWDVPSSFGDTTFFTSPLEPNAVEQMYQEYKATGVEIMPIL